MDYTVIGDTVNLAARLESATKFYGASLVASEGTVMALRGEYPMRKIDRIRVRGKGEAVRLFEIFQPDDAPSEEALEMFSAGRTAFLERRWDEAERCFTDVLGIVPDDGASRLHAERCRRFRQVPPPPDWDGVAML
jgi:adenylate cyclase